jgi:carbamoyl-phosphate synthase large subunit
LIRPIIARRRIAEDREKFERLLSTLQIAQPPGAAVTSIAAAVETRRE